MGLTRPAPSVAFLVAVTSTGPLALNIFVPSMPGLQEVFQVGQDVVELTLSLYLVGVAAGQLMYGPMSDRFGRRPVLLAGLGLYVVASAACALAPGIGLLIVARIAQAMGGCAGMVIGRAIVRDVWGRDHSTRVLALVTMGMAVAPMLGPVLGGVLDQWFGWRAGFAVLVLFGTAVALAGLRGLPETHRGTTPMPGPAALLAAWGALLARPAFLGHALNTALVTAAFFAFLAGAPLAMTGTMGRSPGEFGVDLAFVSVGYMAGNYLASHLAGRWPGERMVVTGTGLAVAAAGLQVALALTGEPGPLALFLPVTLMAFGNGVSLPAAIAAAVGADPRLAGTASGLMGCLQMTVSAIVSASVAALAGAHLVPVMAGVMLMANLGALAAGLYARRDRPHA
jgi:DHA1 family bicyclomycin/chloramphenicol resistance-like MFS transporter